MVAFVRPVSVGTKDPWMDLMQDIGKHAYCHYDPWSSQCTSKSRSGAAAGIPVSVDVGF